MPRSDWNSSKRRSAEHRVADDQQGPALADDLERRRRSSRSGSRSAVPAAASSCMVLRNSPGTVSCIMQRKWRITLIVCVGVFMASLDLFIVNIAFPDIERGLRRHLAGVAVLGPERLRDRLRRAARPRRALGGRLRAQARVPRPASASSSLASAACAAAPSVELLVAARVVQAVGGALMLPTSLGLMLPEFEAHERGAAIGIWAATGGAAAAAGPPLGGSAGPGRLAPGVPRQRAGRARRAWSAGARWLVERCGEGRAAPRPARRRPPSRWRSARSTVAIVQGEDWGWTSAPVLAGFAACAVLLPAVLWRSGRHPSPLVDPAMLRSRPFSLALAGSVVFFAGFGAMLLAGVLFTTERLARGHPHRRPDARARPRAGGDLQRAPSARLAGARRVPGHRA